MTRNCLANEDKQSIIGAESSCEGRGEVANAGARGLRLVRAMTREFFHGNELSLR